MGFLNGGDLGIHKVLGLLNRGCTSIGMPTLENVIATKDSDDVIICVLHNGAFDAAAIVDGEGIYEACTESEDRRPRTWLRGNQSMLEGLTIN